MKLPASISAYVAAANAFDAETAAAQFTPDAHVHDENNDHIGHDAILAWVAETSEKYHPQNEVLSVETRGDEIVTTSRISGDFPGSPAELHFAFTLRNGQIAKLNIG